MKFVCTDFNLARVGLEDCEEVAEDNESRVQLDPSVWAHPIKPNDSSQSPFNNAFRPPNADAFMQQQGIPHAYHAHLAQLQQQQHHHLQQLQQQQRQQQQRQQQQMQQEQHHFLEKLQQSNAMVHVQLRLILHLADNWDNDVMIMIFMHHSLMIIMKLMHFVFSIDLAECCAENSIGGGY